MSSANRSHRAFVNKGISRLCRENREAGLKLNLEIYLFFTGRKSDLIVYTDKLFSI